MKLLGFYIGGHDSNIAYSDESGIVKYYKLERLCQVKHKKGSVEWIGRLCREYNLNPDAVCFSDGNRNGLGCCERGQLARSVAPIAGLFDVPTFCIDHHYGHILSTWPVLDDCNEIQRGICIDGRGDNHVKCSVIDHPFSLNDARVIDTNVDCCICLLLNRVGNMMHLAGGELDFAGKIMGAHAYGHVSDRYVQMCHEHMASGSLRDIFSIDFGGFGIESVCAKLDQTFFDWAASLHRFLGEIVLSIFEKYAIKGRTAYSGGCAQNTVYNEMLDARWRPLIPPHCYDGGLSLGCLEYLALYFGDELTIPDFPFSQQGEDVGYADGKTIAKVCDCISRGKIVGWCQGRGEVGPRALGHRSILLDPSIVDGKRIINGRIKKREFWRPFAGSVLSEDGPAVMTRFMDCPHMLHAKEVTSRAFECMSSIVHVDGTTRFQTVDDTKELHSYRELLESFKMRTGIPAILNTSYNLSGKPIANTRSDILSAFEELDLDVLCVGNELMEKRR